MNIKKLILLASSLISLEQGAMADSEYYIKPGFIGNIVIPGKTEGSEYQSNFSYAGGIAFGMKVTENLNLDLGVDLIRQNCVITYTNGDKPSNIVNMIVPKITAQYNYNIATDIDAYVSLGAGFGFGEWKLLDTNPLTDKVKTPRAEAGLGLVFDLSGIPVDLGYNFAYYHNISGAYRMSHGAKISLTWNF